MKKYFEVDLEVPGHPRHRNQLNDYSRPLLFVFDGWGGDELVTGFGCFLATQSLAQVLKAEGLSGFETYPVEIEKSEQMLTLQPDVVLPRFVRLKFSGKLGESDFVLMEGDVLVVTKEGLQAILATDPKTLRYDPYEES